MSIMDQLKLHSEEIDSKEPILDMSYDWYGRRLAVITADRKISMYKKSDSDGKWEKYTDFQAHYGPIWKIKWAHEFLGAVIATCSIL